MFNAYIAPVWDPCIRQHFHGDKIIEIGIILEFQVKLSVAVRLKSRGQERERSANQTGRVIRSGEY